MVAMMIVGLIFVGVLILIIPFWFFIAPPLLGEILKHNAIIDERDRIRGEFETNRDNQERRDKELRVIGG